MFAKNSRGKHFADIMIFPTLFLGALVVFLIALGSAQSSDVILAAPGQAVTDSITLSDDKDSISITLPTFDLLDLSPESSPCTFQSKTPLEVSDYGCCWYVIVSATNGGCLSEYDDQTTHDYVPEGKKLQNPMQISAEGGNTVDLSTGGILNDCTPSASVTLSQDVTWQDQPLHNGNVYRMEISFIVSEIGCG